MEGSFKTTERKKRLKGSAKAGKKPKKTANKPLESLHNAIIEIPSNGFNYGLLTNQYNRFLRCLGFTIDRGPSLKSKYFGANFNMFHILKLALSTKKYNQQSYFFCSQLIEKLWFYNVYEGRLEHQSRNHVKPEQHR